MKEEIEELDYVMIDDDKDLLKHFKLKRPIKK